MRPGAEAVRVKLSAVTDAMVVAATARVERNETILEELTESMEKRREEKMVLVLMMIFLSSRRSRCFIYRGSGMLSVEDNFLSSEVAMPRLCFSSLRFTLSGRDHRWMW